MASLKLAILLYYHRNGEHRSPQSKYHIGDVSSLYNFSILNFFKKFNNKSINAFPFFVLYTRNKNKK